MPDDVEQEPGVETFTFNSEAAWEKIAALTAELEHAKRNSICDVCAGSGDPQTGVPCICGGSGLSCDAVCNLRAVLERAKSDSVHVQEQHARTRGILTAELRELRDELERVRGERDGLMTALNWQTATGVKIESISMVEDSRTHVPRALLVAQIDDLRAKLAAAEAQNAELVRLCGNFVLGSEESINDFLARIRRAVDANEQVYKERDALREQVARLAKATIEARKTIKTPTRGIRRSRRNPAR